MLKINLFKCSNLEEVKTASAQLDRAIEVTPLKFDVLGIEKQTADWKGIYNISEGSYCKTVSTIMYRVIGHGEFLTTFAETMDRLNIKYEMNIKSIGSTVITDVTFTEKKQEFKELNEEFITGIRLLNSYTRNFPITIMPRLVRLACLNGMILSRAETRFNVKHSSILAKEIERLMETKLNQIINRYQDLQIMVESCIADSIEWNMAAKILEKLINQPKHLEKILAIVGVNRIKTPNPLDKKKSTISYVSGTLAEGAKLTRWTIYNAITQYLSHGEHIAPYVEMFFQNKAEKLLTTSLIEMSK